MPAALRSHASLATCCELPVIIYNLLPVLHIYRYCSRSYTPAATSPGGRYQDQAGGTFDPMQLYVYEGKLMTEPGRKLF